MQSLKMVLSNNFGKQDAWSEFLNQTYSNIGLSKNDLAVGQAVIDKVKPLLPKGGNIPATSAGNASTIESTAPAFVSQFSALQLGLLAAGALIIVYMVARK